MAAYLVAFLSSFLLVYALIPLVKRWAWDVRLVDVPFGRKAHRAPMPLTGGIAMYAGVTAVSLLFAGPHPLVLALVAGGALLVGAGTADDWFKSRGKEFPVLPKLLVQVLAAAVAYALGIRFRGIGLAWVSGAFGGVSAFPPWLSVLATVLWIVAFINMLNFLDGADGLAAGVTAISAATLFIIALVKGQGLTAWLAAVLVGAAVAFLRFNFYPAQLFMGDAGSMFLGFALATVSLEGTMKGATLISLAVTALALGLPVMDAVQVIVSRLLAGRPMYQADRRHVHHRLMSRGFTARQTVVILYLVSLTCSLVSLLLLLYVL